MLLFSFVQQTSNLNKAENRLQKRLGLVQASCTDATSLSLSHDLTLFASLACASKLRELLWDTHGTQTALLDLDHA